MKTQNNNVNKIINKKLSIALYILVASLTLPITVTLVLNINYGAFEKVYLILNEICIVALVSDVLVRYINEISLKWHFGCRIMSKSRSSGLTFVVILALLLLAKNVFFASMIYRMAISNTEYLSASIDNFLPMFLGLFACGATVTSGLSQTVYLSDKIVHLATYQRSINLNEITSTRTIDKKIEIITHSDRFLFNGTEEMRLEIEAEILKNNFMESMANNKAV